MRISAGRRAGRGHRQRDVPCQDAFATLRDPANRRAAAAVADGLGSKPLSHLGSQAACDAAMASLEREPVWDEPALTRAFEAARAAVEAAAAEQGLEAEELATTLQLATLSDGHALAAMVGDGAIVAAGPAALLLEPAPSEFANEVVPLTAADWRSHLRFAESDGASSVLLFTDGLTRLLLTRSRDGWSPFAPFFDSFLPRLSAVEFDDGTVPRFLDGDGVDRSWDDDKCLVVIANGDAAA